MISTTATLLSAALLSATPAPQGFAPQLDLSAKAPDTRIEDQRRAWDMRPVLPSARAEFEGSAPASLPDGPWVVRAGYQRKEQLQRLVRRAAPWRVYPEQRVVIIDVQNLYEYDQLVKEGFVVEIDAERSVAQAPSNEPPSPKSIPNFPCYRTVEESYASAESLVLLKPDIAQWVDIGDSQLKVAGQGGYDMRALRITNRSVPGPKPTLMVLGSIHAREYAPAETVARFAEQLVQGYGVNADITWMVNHHEIHLILQGNPDGRKVAETEFASNNPQARKNRNPNFVCPTSQALNGVDLNRNYGFDFGGIGTSTSICSLVYRGPSAFNESESAAISNYARAIFPDQRTETGLTPPDQTTPISLDANGIYIDLHSNAAGTWYPWGNTEAGVAPNDSQLRTLARKMGFVNGLTANRSSDFGAIGGATDDWTFGALGVASFTVELGGPNFHPTCGEFESTIGPPAVASFFYAARTARAPYRLPAGPDVLALAVSYTPSGATITASANDGRHRPTTGEPVQNIASVAFFSELPWASGATPIANFTPTDGTLDTSVEAVQLTLTSAQLPSGANVLYYARATDAAGNIGPVSAIFLSSPDVILQNGFE